MVTVALGGIDTHRVNDVQILPNEVPKTRKVELLERANEAARSIDQAVVQVSAGYGDSVRRILVANSEGVFAADDQVRTLFRVSVVASGDGGMKKH